MFTQFWGDVAKACTLFDMSRYGNENRWRGSVLTLSDRLEHPHTEHLRRPSSIIECTIDDRYLSAIPRRRALMVHRMVMLKNGMAGEIADVEGDIAR